MQIIIMIKNKYMLAFGLVDDGAENNNVELFSEGIHVNLWELLGGRSPPYQLF
jgi:hypothetical protein